MPIAGVMNQPFYGTTNNYENLGRVLWGIVGVGKLFFFLSSSILLERAFKQISYF
jgi:hypothetical protein